MDWTSLITVVATVIASLGGREFFVWLANRKALARKETAHAHDAEIAVHLRQLERYEQRLTERDEKVDALYRELREEQKRNLELIEQVDNLELEVKLGSLQKCEVRGCASRQPPSTY